MKGVLWLMAGIAMPVILIVGFVGTAASIAPLSLTGETEKGFCVVNASKITVTDIQGFNHGDRVGGDNDQIYNAAVIVALAGNRGLSARDAQIGLMTAIQESQLRNVNYGDRDSLGLFQQRPSMGWGTSEQVRDPYYATGKFYDSLERLKDREHMTLTQAAQAVQRSAYPDAYAYWERQALALLTALMRDPGAGCSLGTGMTKAQADEFMEIYRNSDNAEWDVWSCGCSGGCLANCVSFSIYFINRYTTSHITRATGDGWEVAHNLVYDNICSRGSCRLIDGGHVPRTFAIFSQRTGIAWCGNHVCGHTGVVLGIDEAKDQIIIGEAACGNPSFTGAHIYRLSDWTNEIYEYAYTDTILKGSLSG